MLQCQGETSYLPAYILLPCPYGSALWAAGSYSQESWLWLMRANGIHKSFAVGPVSGRAWAWTCFFWTLQGFTKIFLSCFVFLWARLLVPTLHHKRGCSRFLCLGHKSKRTFMLTVLIMIIFHSLPPTHSGIMVAGYTAGGIFGCLWKLLKDFTVKFTFIYLLLL